MVYEREQIRLDESGDYSILTCPGCRTHDFSGWLHQYKAIVSFRNETQFGMVTVIDENGSKTIWSNDHIGRREWMKLYFRCELCPDHYELTIYQHKGDTGFVMHKIEPPKT